VKTSAIFFVLLLFLLITGCQPLKAPGLPQAAAQQQSNLGGPLYFSGAGEDPAPFLVGLYNSATDNIDIAVYSLTHPDIIKAIGDANKRRVKVRVITDGDQAKGNVQKHAINDLLTIGVLVKVNTHGKLMHLKMSVVDGKTAAIGSYNYTQSASRDNDEVLMVVTQAAAVERCRNEFARMWNSTEFIAAMMAY
jgi:phosphatidylserine/phosphatidylglycerophosphate/cardiolipin synthase-like enzyme